MTRCTRNRAPPSSASCSSRNSAITLAGSVTAVETYRKVLCLTTNLGGVCTGCSSAIAPTITSVATMTALITVS